MGVTISNFHPIFPIVTIRSKMGITARTSMTAKEQEVGFWSIGIHKKLLHYIVYSSGIEIMEKIRLRGTFSYIEIYW